MLWLIFLMFCLLGTVQHFLFVPLGRPRSLSWLLPVSESPWEHYKLAFWPLGGALAVAALLAELPLSSFLWAWFAAAGHGLCTMLGIYYIYRSGLGVSRPVLWLDILNYYITMFFGWKMGLRALLAEASWTKTALASLCLLVCAVLFAWAAILPPENYPMFREEEIHGRNQRTGTS